jgi:hypothetical protein
MEAKKINSLTELISSLKENIGKLKKAKETENSEEFAQIKKTLLENQKEISELAK